jgi:hypothetical protein
MGALSSSRATIQRPGGGSQYKTKQIYVDSTKVINVRFSFSTKGRHTSLMGGTRKNTPEIM